MQNIFLTNIFEEKQINVLKTFLFVKIIQETYTSPYVLQISWLLW